MSYLHSCVSSLLLFSSIFITSGVGAQETPSEKGQPTVEQLQHEIDELRQGTALPGELKYNYRAANVRYFSGPGGVTPPTVILVRLASLCPAEIPDLRRSEQRTAAQFS